MARRFGSLPAREPLKRLGLLMPALAGSAFRVIVGLERRLVRVIERVGRGVTSAIHDLHTGDAQEYLLFLVGIGVLALVVPLLQ